MRNSTDFQGFRAAEVARRLGVRRQTFAQRAAKYGAPRLLSGRYDLDATVAWWHRTTRGNGHGGPRRNAGAKPKGLSADALIEGLVDELMAEFHHAPWPGVFREREPGRRHAFTVDEARSALAELAGAREWIMFAWLMGGHLGAHGRRRWDFGRRGRMSPGNPPRGTVVARRRLPPCPGQSRSIVTRSCPTPGARPERARRRRIVARLGSNWRSQT
jgi:hypothetical protein